MEFFGKPESWILVAFILFVALMVYLKVPAMVAKILDERSAKIARDLDEAAALRREAMKLLESYKKKQIEAEKDAAQIVAQAKLDADEYAKETRRKLSETLERRTNQAEQKIAQAEASAIKEIRNIATNIAVAAATSLVADATRGPRGAGLITESIEAVKTRLN